MKALGHSRGGELMGLDRASLTDAFNEFVRQVVNQRMQEVEANTTWITKDRAYQVYVERLKGKLPEDEKQTLIGLQDALTGKNIVEVEYAYRCGMSDALRLLFKMLVG